MQSHCEAKGNVREGIIPGLGGPGAPDENNEGKGWEQPVNYRHQK